MERLSNRANLEGVQGREMKPEKMRPAKRRKKTKRANRSMSAPSKENTHKGDVVTCKCMGGGIKQPAINFLITDSIY